MTFTRHSSQQHDPRRRSAPPGGTYQITTTNQVPARQVPQTPRQRPTNQYSQPSRRTTWQPADDEASETAEDAALDGMDDDENEDAYAPARMPRSALPYRSTRTQTHTQPYGSDSRVPARASQPVPDRRLMRQPMPEPEPHAPRRWRMHWLFYVGLGLFIMVLGWILFGALSSWWQTTRDDWTYGRPRTFQTDAVVGHNDSVAHPSHFLALNLQGRVSIIEFPGGDPTHARVYLGPQLLGAGDDLAPVTLTFKDVNGDGKPDMIVSVGTTTFIFINDHGQFRPQKPGEQVTM